MTEDRYDFEYVRDREFEAIEIARKKAREKAREKAKEKAGTEIPVFGTGKDDLFGLAFSGGGIRSATFNLGVLQGLSRAKLLKQVDYLSTVSGGGYIGSWLSAWIWREGGDVASVEQVLGSPPDQKGLEPRPVGWLRRYSNYLTAKVGLFSTDTLAAVATYFRNLLLNQVELVAILGIVLLLPLLLTWFVQNCLTGDVPLIIGVLAYAVAVTFINLNLYHRDLERDAKPEIYQQPAAIIWLVVLPLIVSSAGFGSRRRSPRRSPDNPFSG